MTKHKNLRFHNIRELLGYEYILHEKIHTWKNTTDMLTKSIISDKFHKIKGSSSIKLKARIKIMTLNFSSL